MFSAFTGTGKTSQVDPTDNGLGSPLLQRDDDDGPTLGYPEIPVASVTTIGTSASQYSRIGNVEIQERERTEEEKRKISEMALRKQQENAVAFETNLKLEEDEIIRVAKEKRQREIDDAKLAAQLQREEEHTISAHGFTTLMVTVPLNVRGGQVVSIHVPGRGNVSVIVPNGLTSGDTFTVKIPAGSPIGLQHVRVRVPDGVQPGQSFRVGLPNGNVILVGVPPGVRGGQEMIVPYDSDSGLAHNNNNNNNRMPPPPPPPPHQGRRNQSSPSNSQASGGEGGSDEVMENLVLMESANEVNETPEQRKEREQFLAALPADVRAEVLAQETAQKRRLDSFKEEKKKPQLSAEQLELLNSLPVEIREDVEKDMVAELLRASIGNSNNSGAAPPPSSATATASQEGDLLDLSSVPVTNNNNSNTQPPPPPVDLFQNLSIRGVKNNNDASAKNANNQI